MGGFGGTHFDTGVLKRHEMVVSMDESKRIIGYLLVCAAAFVSPGVALGQQFAMWEVNGHYYTHYRSPRLSWPDAKEFAEEQTLFGISGHLATVTSQAEWEFINDRFKLLNSPGATLLGGFQDVSDPAASDPIGAWQWVTGEPLNFAQWGFNEPNDFAAGEEYLEAFDGHWNDVGLRDTRGFLVEHPGPFSFLDARVNDDYQIVISGTGDPVTALRLESPSGSLVPGNDPSPFVAASPNSTSRVSFEPAGGVLAIDGEIVLNTQWNPTRQRDITLVYGLLGQLPRKRIRPNADRYPRVPEYILHGVDPLLITIDDQNRFVLTGTGQQISGIEFTSETGSLTPSQNRTDPFPFLLANSAKKITVGILGEPAEISGSFVLDFGPTSPDALHEIAISVGYGAMPIAIEPNVVCTNCDLPTLGLSEERAFVTNNFPERITELRFASSSVSLDALEFPSSVTVTRVSNEEVMLSSAEGFGPDLLSQLSATWSAFHDQSVFVSFSLPDGKRFGPLPLSLGSNAVPEPQSALLILLGCTLMLGLRNRCR